MSLKEFDAKQFLLEKGERVGLGIALTLMVLMLVISLFMPSKGFFSGSPGEKAKVLEEGASKLETALRSPSNVPQGNDKPEDPAGRLINLDKTFLQPSNYEVLRMFQPAIQESPARRPPNIYNIKEAVVAVKHELIDTYMFSSDFSKVYVLDEKGGGAAGGNNPFAKMYGSGNPNQSPPGAAAGDNTLLNRNRSKLKGVGSNNLTGLSANDMEYDGKFIDVKDWSPQKLTARQPRPLRVAIIAGSFPYKEQLEEFKQQLRLPDINAVLNEMLPEKEGESFKFLGVEVQRMEVDANGNKLGEWSDLPLAETYQLWLKHTFWPFQAEDPKYNLVKFEGLWLPLLRVFHANKKVDPTMRTPGMMMLPGMPQSPGSRGADSEGPDVNKDYPDVVAKLPKLQETLEKLNDVQAARIAAPKSKADAAPFDPFRPYAAPADNTEARNVPGTNVPAPQDLIYPDYALVRLMDVNLEPGHNYRYRVRIKMTNPNYKRSDVASPLYKEAKELKSKNWYEIKQIARVPSELMYYVVDEKQTASKQEQKDILKRGNPSAQYRLWAARPPTPDQVVFQLHRWVESAALSRKESDVVPVGDWAVADRVVVSRGEYVGQKVRVDLPIWKYSQNAYVLPIDETQKKSRNPTRQTPTGIDVDFGFDSSPLDTILLDFEGGRVFHQSKVDQSKVDDVCRTEVLMLSPDGKLLARNSATDTEDEDRKKRRDDVMKRIEGIREGKIAE